MRCSIKTKLIITSGFIMILCIVGILLIKNRGKLETLREDQSLSLIVSAKEEWVLTGLNIDTDTKILIEADGKWSHGNEGYPGSVVFYGPNGYDKKDKQVILPSANVGALVAKIGSGEVFLVGDSHTFTSSQSGELLLAINDGSGPAAYKNNEGELKVIIQLK